MGGVLDILANGSGFVRVDPAGQSRDDVYVSPAQIRRCELRAGDEVSGPVRPPRRNERHPSLVRVAEVNGREAEPPEERPWFGDLTAVFPSARVGALAALESVPFGRGSRVAVAGPPGAGATKLLRELADSLANEDDVDVQVVLAGVRPEEVTEWRSAGDLKVVGGSFDRSPDAQTQAAELAVERAKRRVERGGHAAVIVDSLDALPGGAQRRAVRRGARNRGGRHPHRHRGHRRLGRGAPLGHHPHRARAGRQARRAERNAPRGSAEVGRYRGAGATSPSASAPWSWGGPGRRAGRSPSPSA